MWCRFRRPPRRPRKQRLCRRPWQHPCRQRPRRRNRLLRCGCRRPRRPTSPMIRRRLWRSSLRSNPRPRRRPMRAIRRRLAKFRPRKCSCRRGSRSQVRRTSPMTPRRLWRNSFMRSRPRRPRTWWPPKVPTRTKPRKPWRRRPSSACRCRRWKPTRSTMPISPSYPMTARSWRAIRRCKIGSSRTRPMPSWPSMTSRIWGSSGG